MGQNKTIPLIKNRGVVLGNRGKSSTLRRLRWVLMVIGVMMFYVWIRISTNTKQAAIVRLERQIQEQATENEKLQAEVVALSSFDRIQKTARALGLDFVDHEKIIEISTTP